VAARLVRELFTGKLGLQVFNSLRLVLTGVVLSFVLAVGLALLCTYSKVVESLVTTLCTIFNPLPGMAVLPLLMIWFGIGDGVMLALIVHGVLWPLVTNLLSGFRSIPVIYREWAQNIGLSPLNNLFHVLIFSVMPYFIAGFRIGWGRAWRALISAEMVFGMIGAVGGIGHFIYTNRAYANVTNVFAGVLVIIIIGILIEQLFRVLEKNTVIKWGTSHEK
jgi:NitT/TauT family transport system permease protein